MNYLALAGYDTQQMCDTLPTVLNLAAAGDIALADASDMVTDAMSALGMGVDEAETMVDQMAKTASTTNTSVAQLGEGILTIGATAKSIKGGTAELNTALGILAIMVSRERKVVHISVILSCPYRILRIKQPPRWKHSVFPYMIPKETCGQ